MVTTETRPPRAIAQEAHRGLGFYQATATNLLSMIGVGPFLTIPEMFHLAHGYTIFAAWMLGALLALCDGLVYAQLGAALPESGGSYVYLREAFAPFRLGGFFSFLFAFQVIVTGPLSIASGAVGFSNYVSLYSNMPPFTHHLIAASVCVVTLALLMQKIESVGALSSWGLGLIVCACLGVIGLGVFTTHANINADANLPSASLSGLGPAALLAMYNYGGYNTICNVGGEIRHAKRTIPLSIVTSIIVVVLLYCGMSYAMFRVIPTSTLENTHRVAAEFASRALRGTSAAALGTHAITWVVLLATAGSVFALTLGYSRVLFAAARDGYFFRAFGKLHPKLAIPHVALLTIGALAIPFCFLPIAHIIGLLMVVQIATQFIWVCVGVMTLHRYRKDIPQPFLMFAYPLPALIALLLWAYVFATSPIGGQTLAVGALIFSALVYSAYKRRSV